MVKLLAKRIFRIARPYMARMERLAWSSVGFICRIFPIHNRKIVICSFYGRGYGDNAKYIVEEVLSRDLDVELLWLVKREYMDVTSFPSQVHLVKYKSLRAMYELATAKIWIDNCRKYFFPPKRKGQVYIQTWHGCIGVKLAEKAAEDKLSANYLRIAKNDSNMADLFISNSKWCTNNYVDNFWVSPYKVVESGSPRNDIFFHPLRAFVQRKVRDTFAIKESDRIVLYAPTFRDAKRFSDYSINLTRTITSIERRFGGDWTMLVRVHPNVVRESGEINHWGKVINASSYDDMQELLVSADILITDYSSSTFDFVLQRKPIFLYCSDIADYLQERGFGINIRELNLPYAEDHEQLETEILNFDYENYERAVSKFWDEFGIIETGAASKTIVDVIQNATVDVIY